MILCPINGNIHFALVRNDWNFQFKSQAYGLFILKWIHTHLWRTDNCTEKFFVNPQAKGNRHYQYFDIFLLMFFHISVYVWYYFKNMLYINYCILLFKLKIIIMFYVIIVQEINFNDYIISSRGKYCILCNNSPFYSIVSIH